MAETLQALHREVAHLGSENTDLHREVVRSREERIVVSKEWAERVQHLEQRNHELKHENAQLRHRLDAVTMECDEVKIRMHTALQQAGALVPTTKQHISTNERVHFPISSSTMRPSLPEPAHTSGDVDRWAQRSEAQILQQMKIIKTLEGQVQELTEKLSASESAAATGTVSRGKKIGGVPMMTTVAQSSEDVAGLVSLQTQIKFLHGEITKLENALKEEHEKNAELSRTCATFEDVKSRLLEMHSNEIETLQAAIKKMTIKENTLLRKAETAELELKTVTSKRSEEQNESLKRINDMQNAIAMMTAERARYKASHDEMLKLLDKKTLESAALKAIQKKEAGNQTIAVEVKVSEVQYEKYVTDASSITTTRDIKSTEVAAVPYIPVMFHAAVQATPASPPNPPPTSKASAITMEALQHLSRERDMLHIQLDDAVLAHKAAETQLRDLERAHEELQISFARSQQELVQQTSIASEFEQALRREEERNRLLLNDNTSVHQERRALMHDVSEKLNDNQHMLQERERLHQQLQDALLRGNALELQIQEAAQREVSLQNAIKHRESDYNTLMMEYRRVTQSSDADLVKAQNMEKLVQSLQASLAAAQDQLQQEMARGIDSSRKEEMLSSDVQNLTYENSSLHRKLDEILYQQKQWESAVQQLQQHLTASQGVNRELERSYNDLMKTHCLSDNEIALLRQQSHELQCEVGVARTAYDNEQRRCRQLEEEINKMMLKELRGNVASGISMTPPPVPSRTAVSNERYEEEVQQLKFEKHEMEKKLGAQIALVQMLDEENRKLRMTSHK
eukprot:PhF_6_TR27167/c0_g1_i1/m.39789